MNNAGLWWQEVVILMAPPPADILLNLLEQILEHKQKERRLKLSTVRSHSIIRLNHMENPMGKLFRNTIVYCKYAELYGESSRLLSVEMSFFRL